MNARPARKSSKWGPGSAAYDLIARRDQAWHEFERALRRLERAIDKTESDQWEPAKLKALTLALRTRLDYLDRILRRTDPETRYAEITHVHREELDLSRLTDAQLEALEAIYDQALVREVTATTRSDTHHARQH